MHQSVEINVRNIEFADNIFQMLSNIRIRPRMPPAAICLYFPSFIVWKSIGYYPILQIYWREYLFRRKGSTRVWEYIIILYTYMRVMCVLAHYPATSIGWRSPFHMHTRTKKKNTFTCVFWIHIYRNIIIYMMGFSGDFPFKCIYWGFFFKVFKPFFVVLFIFSLYSMFDDDGYWKSFHFK